MKMYVYGLANVYDFAALTVCTNAHIQMLVV